MEELFPFLGEVLFFPKIRLIATDTSAPYSVSYTPDALGPQTFWATTTDSQGLSASSPRISIRIRSELSAPTVELSSPSRLTSLIPQSFLTGAEIPLRAVAADSDGEVVRVEFYCYELDTFGAPIAVKVAEDSVAPFEATAAFDLPGSHRLFARAIDNDGQATDSDRVSVEVVAPSSAPPAVDFGAPPGGWPYTLEMSDLHSGAPGSGATSLDGTWSHDIFLDAWDGSGLGGPLSESDHPGGIRVFDGYGRFQDVGQPADYGFPSPNNNSGIFLTRDLEPDGFAPTFLDDGMTLYFVARVPGDGLVDPLFPASENAPRPYPEAGDETIGFGDGLGNIVLTQPDGQTISFSLAARRDASGQSGLTFNRRNASVPSADVDFGESGAPNTVALDPLEWHEFWIQPNHSQSAAYGVFDL